jgi:hypothetical protein
MSTRWLMLPSRWTCGLWCSVSLRTVALHVGTYCLQHPPWMWTRMLLRNVGNNVRDYSAWRCVHTRNMRRTGVEHLFGTFCSGQNKLQAERSHPGTVQFSARQQTFNACTSSRTQNAFARWVIMGPLSPTCIWQVMCMEHCSGQCRTCVGHGTLFWTMQNMCRTRNIVPDNAEHKFCTKSPQCKRTLICVKILRFSTVSELLCFYGQQVWELSDSPGHNKC